MTVHGRSRLTMLAGWLFADLFLVLLIAGLAAMPAKSTGNPGKPPISSPPTQPPLTSAHPAGLDPNHVDFTVNLSPVAFRNGATEPLLDRVNAELDRRNPTHRPVGFVLAFASDDLNHANRATETATQVVELLRASSPIFATSSGFGYWNGNHNNFEFKIFLLN